MVGTKSEQTKVCVFVLGYGPTHRFEKLEIHDKCGKTKQNKFRSWFLRDYQINKSGSRGVLTEWQTQENLTKALQNQPAKEQTQTQENWPAGAAISECPFLAISTFQISTRSNFQNAVMSSGGGSDV